MCIEGEMLVSSPSMSKGYLNQEEETKRSYITEHEGSDGRMGSPRIWYRTGDIVRVERDIDRYKVRNGDSYWFPVISVMGRLSSVITLRNGVIVSPDVLEGIYAISPLLSQCYLYGNESMEGLLAIVSSTDNFDEKWREIDVDMNAKKRCLLNEFSSIARRNGLREEVCIACSYLL